MGAAGGDADEGLAVHVVAAFATEVEADVAVARLRSTGIDAARTSVQMHRWTGVPSPSPLTVSVRRADLDRARAILQATPDELPEEFRAPEVEEWSRAVGRRRTGDLDLAFRARSPLLPDDGRTWRQRARFVLLPPAILVGGAFVVWIVVALVIAVRG